MKSSWLLLKSYLALPHGTSATSELKDQKRGSNENEAEIQTGEALERLLKEIEYKLQLERPRHPGKLLEEV